MLLATRCPFCETVFRLQAAQLAQHRGLVRCGHCHEVFDASGSLFDVSDGGDFSNAKQVAAAAVIDGLSGERSTGFGSAVEAPPPVAASETAASHAPTGAGVADVAGHAPFTRTAGDASFTSAAAGAATTAAPPPRRTEPQAPSAPFSSQLAADAEPVLADAPLEPFAYQPDAEPAAQETPQVWHKTARAAQAAVNPASALHGIPDNEPYFGAAGLGATGLGATGSGAAGASEAGIRAAGFGAAGVGAAPVGATAAGMTGSDSEPRFGTAPAGASAAAFGAGATSTSYTAAAGAGGAGGPRGPSFNGGPIPSSGEPFSVNPVNDGTDPFRVTREPRPVQGRRIGLTIAAAVVGLALLVGLLAQLAWWQRETVQVYFPSSQALYVKACTQLGCLVTPPHDIDGLQVEPSDLRQVDGPHKLELKMPLHNRFNIALAYPAIELTLLDDQNNVAVRRVLWPQDYVPPGTPIAAGLPAHTTQTMIVHLDTGAAIASNFRVQIFYP